MPHLKDCPFGQHSHRKQSAFLKCERANGPREKWRKSTRAK